MICLRSFLPVADAKRIQVRSLKFEAQLHDSSREFAQVAAPAPVHEGSGLVAAERGALHSGKPGNGSSLFIFDLHPDPAAVVC